MVGNKPPLDIRRSLQMALFKSLLIPVLLLAFFIAAPRWLNYKLHADVANSINSDPNLSSFEKEDRLQNFAGVDFQQVCFNCPRGFEKLHDRLEQSGINTTFRRLRWGLILSTALVAGLLIAMAAIFALNARARKSQDDLIQGYRFGWAIAMVAALAKVFLLIPLLAYGTFEFTVLLSGQYFPKLLLMIVLGGLFALWKSAGVILKRVPLEFQEHLCREVTPQEAPELWNSVCQAANKLQTAPPDRILIGMQLNFFVTELAVRFDSGRTQGKTLFLSYPLLKQLSGDEVLAIIGHELGHFIGQDTRLTREFYPLRFKIHGTMVAMVRSGWMGWASFQFLNFFGLCFGETERKTSRERELLADQKAASLTTPETAAQALVKFQVSVEAFQRNLTDAVKSGVQNALDIPLQAVVREKLAPDQAFWTNLFEQRLPHPLDTHPSLHTRLEALHQQIDPDKARAIALTESPSAYAMWFSNRGALFTGLAQQAEAAIGKLRAHSQIAAADCKTQEGKDLLNRHFPEIKWRYKQSGLWAAVVMLALIVAGCVAALIFIDVLVARVLFTLLALVLGLALAVVWRRHRNAEFVLTAEGIDYTGWNRPLRFADVEAVLVRRYYTTLTLIFRLKEKQLPFRKLSLLKIRVKSVSFSLNCLDSKPVPTAQTIYRYFTRQPLPENAPVPVT